MTYRPLMLVLAALTAGSDGQGASPALDTTHEGGVASPGHTATSGEDSSVRLNVATPGGPQLLQVMTNGRRLTSGESIVFSAMVLNPDGVDVVIGGIVLDAAVGGSYGTFVTSAAEGA